MRKIVCDCGKKIRVYEKTLGKHGKCPRCNKMITISAHIWQNPPELTEIGTYSIIREISRGNIGILYEAIDQNEKRYAIKITYADETKQHEALATEYELLKNIEHRNVISYKEKGMHEKRSYLVMDFIDGKSLEDTLLTIPQQLPLTITLQLVKKMASILGYLHAHNIVHANFKPANILFTSNYEIIIINFSVAKKINQNQTNSELIGSPKYMAPEYRSGEQKIQPASDIYSLGCILFELLTGETAISDENLLQSNFQISLAPSGLKASIPPEIDQVCMKALCYDLGERYTNISPLVYDIETFLGQEHQNLSAQLQNFFHEFQHPLVYSINPEIFLEKDFERYQIISLLHKSKKSVLYKALDSKSNKIVVLRILFEEHESKEINDYPSCLKTIQKLRHPNLVKILSYGKKPQLYYTLEYIKGSSLLKLIGSYKYKRIATIFYKVAMAFHFVHQHNILHSNITLECVKLNENLEPKILGFELSALYKDQNLLLESEDTHIIKYASPERILNSIVDFQSDIYSLGAVLYHVLTGRQPFSGKRNSITQQTIHATPIKPRLLNPEIPEYLEQICLSCIEKSSDKRYSTMEWLALDLKNFMDGNKPPKSKSRKSLPVFKYAKILPLLIFVILIFTYLGYLKNNYQSTLQAQQKKVNTILKQNIALHSNDAQEFSNQMQWELSGLHGLQALQSMELFDSNPEELGLSYQIMLSLVRKNILLGQLVWAKVLADKNVKVKLSTDHTILATTIDRNIQILEMETGKEIYFYQAQEPIVAFTFARDDSLILCLESNRLLSLSYQKQTVQDVYKLDQNFSVLASDSSQYFCLIQEKHFEIFDIEQKISIGNWDMEVSQIEISTSGNFMATIEAKKLIVWDMNTKFPVFSYTFISNDYHAFAFAENSSLFAVYDNNNISVYDNKGNRKNTFLVPGTIKKMAFSYQDDYIFVLSGNYIYKYNVYFPILQEVFPAVGAQDILLSSSNALISVGKNIFTRKFDVIKTNDFTANSLQKNVNEAKISEIELSRYDFIRILHNDSDYTSISPDQKYLAVLEDGKMFIWDIVQQKLCTIVYRSDNERNIIPITSCRFINDNTIYFDTSTSSETILIEKNIVCKDILLELEAIEKHYLKANIHTLFPFFDDK